MVKPVLPSLLFFLLFILLPIFASSSLVGSSPSSPPSGFEDLLNDSAGPRLSLAISLGVSQAIMPFPTFDLREEGEKEGSTPQTSPVPPQQSTSPPGMAAGGGGGEKRNWNVVRGKCTYTVSVKTSCSSPRITRDMVSLAFGDAYGNEVYAARLDDPATGTFERCSTDTFRIAGPCSHRICYQYLRRSGRDGWIPESVKVYSHAGSGSAVTFFYNTPLPDGAWYGFNICHDKNNHHHLLENEDENRRRNHHLHHRRAEDETKVKRSTTTTTTTIQLI